MKKVNKVLKIFFLVAIAFCLTALISSVGFYFYSTKGSALDHSRLSENESVCLQILDINGTPIKATNENFISIKKLSSNTKNAFICAEDKRFYSHKGLDYIRIGGAIVTNLKNKSFSQGGSTISQQLIKNTHLSNEKTIKRKLKEIKLTKELEKNYTKEQILEMYLNNIYFGNGCYGIENASNHYFGKSSTKLTIAESAILAGTINAPSIYDIENNPTKAISRRNLILGLMKDYGKISIEDYNNAINEELTLNLTKLSGHNQIVNDVLKEATIITGKTENQLKNNHYIIQTEIDLSLQNQINSKIKSSYSNIESSPSIASIVINNKTNKIIAISGNKNTLSSNKQPGSTIKPILVFAPAIENGIISPATKILDEKINISGYSPENADKKYHGYVSVRECLKNSYNIPAVKILQETGIETAQNFANKLGIKFDKLDSNLAIALGGLTTGTTLKNLADAYSSFANLGQFEKSSYISKITSKDQVIYSSKSSKTNVMSDSTAYLITDMLKDTAKTGTAKRLKNFNFDIASKTGTVGTGNSNSDAFNISYTSNHTIISYFGESTMPNSINGATYPTMLTKDILEFLYSTKTPQNFEKPNSVEKKLLNKTDYENNIVSQTDSSENSITEIFAKSNPPQKTNSTINLNLEVFNFENEKPILCFFTSPNYTYNIIRKEKEKEEIISSLENIINSETIKFTDKNAKSNQIYEYFIEICEKFTNKTYKTNSVKLKTF